MFSLFSTEMPVYLYTPCVCLPHESTTVSVSKATFQFFRRLKEAEAKRVFGIVTHGVFSGPAIQRINDSDLEAVCATNTIPLHEKMAACPKIKVTACLSNSTQNKNYL